MESTKIGYMEAPVFFVNKNIKNIPIIEEIICKHFGLSLDRIKEKNRHRFIVEARQIFVYILKNKTNMSLVDIGKFFNRTHCFSLYSINRINDFIKMGDELGKKATYLLNKI